MNRKNLFVVLCLLAAVFMSISDASGAKRSKQEIPLSSAAEKLYKQYSDMLTALQAEIEKALPKVDEQQKAAYLKAREAEKAAEAHANATQEALNKNRGHVGLLNHRKGWIGRATKGVAEAKEKLKQAEAMTGDTEQKAKAVKEAQEALAKIQENYDMAASELKKSQAAVDKAKLEGPKLVKELKAAKEALALAQAKTMKAVNELNLKPFLASDKLDGQLAKYVVLTEATPRGLAEFAQEGKKQEELIKKLLADADLMTQMVVADGAKNGKYGQAMKIYTDIQKASRKARYGVLQRLALAISLEHAVPVGQRNAKSRTDAPATVDPVKRYLHFEKTYLNDELDPGFKGLSVWDYRMVVDGEEPEEILTWGRKMLGNYRPDHISTPDYRWRYVAAVRTEVRYGSQDNKYDKPELQFFQNILMNGGVCGRRAFFGRFILRAFGIPTLARPQRGHAALAHWTPDGWVVCLGGGWGVGWVKGRNKDLDFLATTQARNSEKAFLQVKRAQWVGDVLGEKRIFGFLSGDPDFWNGVALYQQRAIIEEAKAVALAAVGEDIGEANETKEKVDIAKVTITEADKKILVGRDGVITIPAAACSKPTKSTGKIIFMESNLGGMQLHYSRNGKPEEFEYTFGAPKAGKYALTARVVTPSWKQYLRVTANGAEKPIDIALPFTVGMWDKTQPVEVTLARGKNVLTFSREHEGLKGLTIKDFTLTPIRQAQGRPAKSKSPDKEAPVTMKSVKELQDEFLKLKFGMFIHFNLATYKGVEWVSGYHDPSTFNPGVDSIDTDAWADAAVSAGMKYGVLTAKHVSGFCLWDSKYTTYDVMHPDCPYQQDLVAQFIKSFKSRGLKVGLYYSWRHPGFGDAKKYKVLPPECDPATHTLKEQNEFQKAQIAELLTKYPDVFYIWNDALDPKVMPADEMLTHIRGIRPNILASSNWWNWGKKGTPYADIAVKELRHFPETNKAPGETCWKLEQKWFWKEGFRAGNAKGVMSNMAKAHSRNSNFLLNVAPDKNGNFEESSIKTLAEIGKLLKEKKK